MTWKELQNRIEKMPEEEQEKSVTVWEEEEPMRDATLERCTEDLYCNNDWDCGYYESDLEEEELNDTGTYLIARKGHYYLDFE